MPLATISHLFRLQAVCLSKLLRLLIERPKMYLVKFVFTFFFLFFFYNIYVMERWSLCKSECFTEYCTCYLLWWKHKLWENTKFVQKKTFHYSLILKLSVLNQCAWLSLLTAVWIKRPALQPKCAQRTCKGLKSQCQFNNISYCQFHESFPFSSQKVQEYAGLISFIDMKVTLGLEEFQMC